MFRGTNGANRRRRGEKDGGKGAMGRIYSTYNMYSYAYLCVPYTMSTYTKL